MSQYADGVFWLMKVIATERFSILIFASPVQQLHWQFWPFGEADSRRVSRTHMFSRTKDRWLLEAPMPSISHNTPLGGDNPTTISWSFTKEPWERKRDKR
jgi:hypothetical protein